MHSFQLSQLVSRLKDGAVIAYPTETVWGLGCLPNDEFALQRLANIKQRSTNKGFILVSPNIEYCLPFIDPKYHILAIQNIQLNLKKPTTWLIPKAPQTSTLISGQFNTIAIRISPHPFIKKVCDALQMPLISTSANMHSRPSLNSGLLVQRILGAKVDKIIYGYPNGSGQASTIVDCLNNQIVRY